MTTFTDHTAEARKEKKEFKRQSDLAQNDREKSLNELYATPEGRTLLWWLLDLAGLPTYIRSNQIISEMIITNPEAFAGLLTEKYDARRRDTDDGDDGDGEGGSLVRFANLDDERNQYS